MNPFGNPFGIPGDPMEQVLSLQSFSGDEPGDGEAASNQCSGSNSCSGSNICTNSNSCKNSNECANSNDCGDDQSLE